MRKTLQSFLVMMLCFSMVAVAQVSPHTGTVKDDKGNPIPYATVKVKGGTQVAVADEKGVYKINAADNAVLIFSATGFTDTESKVSKNGSYRSRYPKKTKRNWLLLR
jgi:hypothetical protein